MVCKIRSFLIRLMYRLSVPICKLVWAVKILTLHLNICLILFVCGFSIDGFRLLLYTSDSIWGWLGATCPIENRKTEVKKRQNKDQIQRPAVMRPVKTIQICWQLFIPQFSRWWVKSSIRSSSKYKVCKNTLLTWQKPNFTPRWLTSCRLCGDGRGKTWLLPLP